MTHFKWQLLNTAALPREGNDPGGKPPLDAPKWIDKVTDAETVGYFKNRGLDGKSIEEALFETAKAHREAQKIIGVPQDELVRVPKPTATPEEKKAFHVRLGMPGDPKEYEFGDIKDDKVKETLLKAATNGNLSKEAAAAVAKEVSGYLTAIETERAAQAAEKLTLEKAELAKSWGANYAANKIVAENAARALGIDPAAVAALEQQVGYGKVMEMFRTIGTKIGEDTLVKTPGGGGVMTREEAIDRKASLMADAGFRKKFLDGDTASVRELQGLDKIITGVA